MQLNQLLLIQILIYVIYDMFSGRCNIIHGIEWTTFFVSKLTRLEILEHNWNDKPQHLDLYFISIAFNKNRDFC